MAAVAEMPKLYSVREIVERVPGLGKSTLYALIRKGHIKIRKLPGTSKLLIPEDELIRFLQGENSLSPA